MGDIGGWGITGIVFALCFGAATIRAWTEGQRITTFLGLLVTAALVAAVVVPAASASNPSARAASCQIGQPCYQQCTDLAARWKALHRRIVHVQDAIDVSTSTRHKRALRKTLRHLKAELARVQAKINAHCD
jgi:hypothetical protein